MTYLDAIYPPKHAKERGDYGSRMDIDVSLGIELECLWVVVRCGVQRQRAPYPRKLPSLTSQPDQRPSEGHGDSERHNKRDDESKTEHDELNDTRHGVQMGVERQGRLGCSGAARGELAPPRPPQRILMRQVQPPATTSPK